MFSWLFPACKVEGRMPKHTSAAAAASESGCHRRPPKTRELNARNGVRHVASSRFAGEGGRERPTGTQASRFRFRRPGWRFQRQYRRCCPRVSGRTWVAGYGRRRPGDLACARPSRVRAASGTDRLTCAVVQVLRARQRTGNMTRDPFFSRLEVAERVGFVGLRQRSSGISSCRRTIRAMSTDILDFLAGAVVTATDASHRP